MYEIDPSTHIYGITNESAGNQVYSFYFFGKLALLNVRQRSFLSVGSVN